MNKQGQFYMILAAVITLTLAIFAVGVHADYSSTVSNSGNLVNADAADTPASDLIMVRGACSEQPTPDGGSACSGCCDYGTCRKTHVGDGCVCAAG